MESVKVYVDYAFICVCCEFGTVQLELAWWTADDFVTLETNFGALHVDFGVASKGCSRGSASLSSEL